MSILDMTAIQNLKTLQEKTGRDLLGNLVQLYIETTPEIISQMQSLLGKKEYEELSRAAHSLKSSSANIGALKMTELCKEIEYKIIDDDKFEDSDLESLIEAILEAFPNTLVALKELKV